MQGRGGPARWAAVYRRRRTDRRRQDEPRQALGQELFEPAASRAGRGESVLGVLSQSRPVGVPTQLFFLFQRARQIEQIRQSDLFSSRFASRTSCCRRIVFAELNLDPHELGLYQQVADTLELEPPTPDLVVYLQAPAQVLLNAWRREGILRALIEPEYLERLGDAYARFFYDFDAAPLLIVNAATIDPVHRESDYQELLQTILRVKHGRHFFNPAGAPLT